jgi:hypothetical protein
LVFIGYPPFVVAQPYPNVENRLIPFAKGPYLGQNLVIAETAHIYRHGGAMRSANTASLTRSRDRFRVLLFTDLYDPDSSIGAKLFTYSAADTVFPIYGRDDRSHGNTSL